MVDQQKFANETQAIFISFVIEKWTCYNLEIASFASTSIVASYLYTETIPYVIYGCSVEKGKKMNRKNNTGKAYSTLERAPDTSRVQCPWMSHAVTARRSHTHLARVLTTFRMCIKV